MVIFGSPLLSPAPTLSPFIQSKVGTTEAFTGPNCYYTALRAAEYLNEDPRYVDGLEIRYLLTMLTQPVGRKKALPGAIAIFQSDPFRSTGGMSLTTTSQGGSFEDLLHGYRIRTGGSHLKTPATILRGAQLSIAAVREPRLDTLYDDGVHAALLVGGSMVFQKLGFFRNDNYELAALEEAMRNVDYAAWLHKDRFERGTEPSYGVYRADLYQRRSKRFEPELSIPIEPDTKTRLTLIFQFYSDMLSRCSFIKQDKFAEERLNLLTVENIWGLLRQFEREYIKSMSTNLLNMDADIAKAYLKLHSLSWQYEAIKDEYMGGQRIDIKDLYRNNYLRDRQALEEEIYAHLTARGITDKAKQDSIYKNVMTAIDAALPAIIGAANDSITLPFYEILENTIGSQEN